LVVLGLVWAGLGIESLADAEYGTAAYQLAFSIAWLLLAGFRDRLPAARGRQRTRLRS